MHIIIKKLIAISRRISEAIKKIQKILPINQGTATAKNKNVRFPFTELQLASRALRRINLREWNPIRAKK